MAIVGAKTGNHVNRADCGVPGLLLQRRGSWAAPAVFAVVLVAGCVDSSIPCPSGFERTSGLCQRSEDAAADGATLPDSGQALQADGGDTEDAVAPQAHKEDASTDMRDSEAEQGSAEAGLEEDASGPEGGDSAADEEDAGISLPQEAVVCIAGEHVCRGSTLEQCVESGVEWVALADCVTADFCDDQEGKCLGEPCMTEGAQRCTEATGEREQCLAGVWQVHPCSDGEFCEPDGAGATCGRIACPGQDTSGCPEPPACHQSLCDGTGNCDTKVLADGTGCEGGVCSDGKCVECRGDGDCQDSYCDTDTQRCVECLEPAHCADSSNECGAPACTPEHRCSVQYANRGDDCPGAAGYCNGLGALSSCVECTQDDHCPGQVCAGNSTCVGCLEDADCSGDQRCAVAEQVCRPPRCGDGVVDRDLGEQCDPGADRPGCQDCRITGSYGYCPDPGQTPGGECFNSGNMPPALHPYCMSDEECPPVPGGSVGVECLEDRPTCWMTCPCPVGYVCNDLAGSKGVCVLVDGPAWGG